MRILSPLPLGEGEKEGVRTDNLLYMKTKNITLLLLLFVAFIACKKDDVFEDPGITTLYMPQASLNNGGNEYNVPFGGNSENYTFDETTKKLKIVLGVKNSGLSTDGFAVKVKVDAQATNAYVEKYKNDEKKPAVVLPEGSYTLPESATIPSGKNEESFYLEVDMQKILTAHPDYYKNRIALAVTIYGNEKILASKATTIVVIDGAKFLPTPPEPPKPTLETMLKKDAWKVLKQGIDGKITADAKINIVEGNIHYSSGKVGGKFNHVIYQPVNVEKGQTYTYDMHMEIKGQAWGWIQAYVSEHEPEEGKDFGDGKVLELQNNITSPMSGSFAELSAIQDQKTYTAGKTGKIYFVIKIGSWDNNFEDLALSDIVFKKDNSPKPPKPAVETRIKKDAWKILLQGINGGLSEKADITFTDGNIHYTSGTEGKKFNHVIYQPIEVSGGETYTYDMTLTAKGKAWGWIQVYISQWEPEEGKDFNDSKVFDLSGEIKTPKSGLMSELASGEKTYTATKSGKLFFVIKIGSWDNNYEDLTFSDIFIKKAP